ncbi:fasciclin domain-containing protein [Hymenobacter wooponensis]|uniref:Fasciclin domain-containing protein n=1 Tax=Hymenobacter wooponensis TaxID=1525360 RepID=A0A4Z0MRT9_9BACT|nr:fasciclin domain-containing protein [Hymenobacter wooponensis]TGD82294.1 fasciclin domain-containing protein [Hymenobacter wooponensis]
MPLLHRVPGLFLLWLTGLAFLTACSKEPADTPEPTPGLEKVLREQADYTTLVAALTKTDLLPALRSAKPLTLLAPTNAAFAELQGTPYTSAPSIEALTDAHQVAELRELLLYHMLPDQLLSSLKVFEDKPFTTLAAARGRNTTQLYIESWDTRYYINGYLTAQTISPGESTDGGVVYSINHVLRPPTLTVADFLQNKAAQPSSGYTLFWQALQRPAASGLRTQLADASLQYTVLLPTDAGLLQTLRFLNPTWTDLAQVPDAQLLALVQLHVLPQHLTSFGMLGADKPFPTLAGTSWPQSLTFKGSISLATIPPTHNLHVATYAQFTSVPEDQQPRITDLDILATNGVVHLVDAAVKP